MKPSQTDGLVYYLLDATRLAQRVKIGYTTRLGPRIVDITRDTMMQQTPIVLALEEGGKRIELGRHIQFHDLRIMGEWFEYGPALQAHLSQLPNPIGWLRDHPELWHYAAGWHSFNGFVRQRKKTAPVPRIKDQGISDYAGVEF